MSGAAPLGLGSGRRETSPPVLQCEFLQYHTCLLHCEHESLAGSASSGYANNLGALRSLGLIDYPSPGMVAATDLLFLT